MTTELVEIDSPNSAGFTAREASLPSQDVQGRGRRILRSRVTLPSIVAIEGAVFLGILYTLARGSAELPQSTLTLATLSVLFFLLSLLRRRASAYASED